VFLDGKEGLGEKRQKGDAMTRFWYTLKNLHPLMTLMSEKYI